MGKAAMVAKAPEAVVRVRDLHKWYKRTHAVCGVDLDVRPGEMFGLIGADGMGKSSVIKSIAGVLAHDEGTIDVFGQRIDSERAAERVKGRIGLMTQGLGQNLYPELSVAENVEFFGRLRLVPPHQLAARKERLLAITRLDRFKSRPMKQLSGGMKQKLGLVCTLIHEPDLVLLDEPTTGVDPLSRRDFWTVLTELVYEKSMTAIVSTAYLDEAAYCDRLALMLDGCIVSQGKEEDVTALTPGTVVKVIVREQLAALRRLKTSFRQVEVFGEEIHVFVEDATPAEATRQVEARLAGTTVDSLTAARPDLEDVLVTLRLRRESTPEPVAESSATWGSSGMRTASPLAQGDSGLAPEGTAVQAKELVRMFGDFRAVDGVSFTIRNGEIFGLLGANGAGKTTVIKMLSGLLPPSDGIAIVAGCDMRSGARSVKERIGYMSQVFSLYLDLTVIENIKLYAGIYGLSGKEADQRLRWVSNMASLQEHETRLTESLPVGLRQRLALGCALVHRPRVLFLDEPTSGVDALGRRRFWETLVRLSREHGVAALVTTHYMSEAEHCDSLALMHSGRIVASGSPSSMRNDLRREAGCPLDLEVDQPREALEALRRGDFPGAALLGHHVRVLSKDVSGDGERIRRTLSSAGLSVHAIEESRVSMQDVFVHRIRALEETERVSVGGRM